MEPLAFQGRLRDRDHADAPVDASITFEEDALVAEAAGGHRARLPWRGLRLRRSDAGALECSSGGVTISSTEPGFQRALEAAGGNEVADALARLDGETVASPWVGRLGCTLALGVAVFIAVRLPACFTAVTEGVAEEVPYSVDEAIGEFASDQVPVEGGTVSDPVLREAVQVMVDRLAPHRSLADAEFRFRIVDNDLVNAFALPGGHIVVFTGLLETAETPEEVAGVLAHEIAHVTQRHGIRQVVKAAGLTAVIGITLGDLSGLESLIVEVLQNGYGRDAESEADAEGVRMMVAARLDPRGLARFFERLDAEQEVEIPEWLSTHPDSLARASRVQALAAEAGAVDWEPLAIDWDAVKAALEAR
jgi:hypothetical protein